MRRLSTSSSVRFGSRKNMNLNLFLEGCCCLRGPPPQNSVRRLCTSSSVQFGSLQNIHFDLSGGLPLPPQPSPHRILCGGFAPRVPCGWLMRKHQSQPISGMLPLPPPTEIFRATLPVVPCVWLFSTQANPAYFWVCSNCLSDYF